MATKAPTETPVTQTKIPTPLPRPVAEWALKKVSINQNTVIVSVFLHSTATITVKLDGAPPTRRDDTAIPVLNYVFEAMPAGQHSIYFSDVKGNVETTSVLVDWTKPIEDIAPEWLADLEVKALDNPTKSITKYRSKTETAYYVVKECCDQFSDLLDAHGGIAGRCDGVTIFDPTGLKGEAIWLTR